MIPTSDQPAASPPFPGDDSLCESCGYSLRGLLATGICPECGSAISESDPAKRTGLPWQNEMSLRSWMKTTWMMIRRPREAYRVMRVATSSSISKRDLGDLVYLFTFSIPAGLLCAFTLLRQERKGTRNVEFSDPVAVQLFSYTIGSAIFIAVLALIESLGVAWVARRRGWRVSKSLAFSIACYASVSWLLSTLITCFALLWHSHDIDLWGWYPFPGGLPDLFILIIIFAISILWFETLVWLGVRQVKFANSN